MWLDVFVYHRDHDKSRVSRLKRAGWLDEVYGGEHAVYVASQYGTVLPHVSNCTLHGVRTKCFGRAEGRELLTMTYGPNYLVPDRKWDPSARQWFKKR